MKVYAIVHHSDCEDGNFADVELYKNKADAIARLAEIKEGLKEEAEDEDEDEGYEYEEDVDSCGVYNRDDFRDFSSYKLIEAPLL